MLVVVRSPGSCGELVQGKINGRELLVSLPVNIYSTITLTYTKDVVCHRPHTPYFKVYSALEQLSGEIGEKNIIKNIDVKIESSIPIGKGMASSTADVCGAILAFCELFNLSLSDEDFAKFTTNIEPTDSIIFKRLTLFDNVYGKVIDPIAEVPNISILILEGRGKINTLKHRNQKDYLKKVQNIDLAYDAVVEGIKSKDIRKVGEGALLSAYANQALLYRPYLEELTDFVSAHNLLGLNIAHSGSVVGLWYDNTVDIEKIIKECNRKFNKFFLGAYKLKTIMGGPQVIKKEG